MEDFAGYKQLYEAITITISKNKKNDVEEPYHRALIEDYCLFIQSLHTLAQSWKVNEGDTFLLARQTKSIAMNYGLGICKTRYGTRNYVSNSISI